MKRLNLAQRKNMEAIGIGDLHLTNSSGVGSLAKYIDDPDDHIIREVKKVLSYARSKGVQNIFLYGDICDGPRLSYSAWICLIRLFSKSKFSKTEYFEWYIIIGNHDMLSELPENGHSMEVVQELNLPNVHIYTEPTKVEIDGATVNFLPWPATAFDKTCLNVAHIEVEGSQGDRGRVMTGNGLVKSSAITVAGHLHTMHKIRNTYYSGTLGQKNFGENLPKYFHHIVFNSVKDYEISNIPFEPEYKLINLVIDSKDALKQISNDPKHLTKVIVKDGVDVVLPDYPNLVIIKAFKTKDELQSILTEDLLSGEEFIIKTETIFNQYLEGLELPAAEVKYIKQLRRDILNGPSK